eukprot:CAMPEP_0174730920 /NCGR_PEP_ID=MMETSP1094-20130205/56514_1 /TAXON_ID=156173 /ORGANISM="Chrysochromulina brevifilum, Strain UTEX LB 985" /LENGTH=38 /DNA_ID= /DNA_START= /DNA_END= /DNA_ORIENTATION=
MSYTRGKCHTRTPVSALKLSALGAGRLATREATADGWR